MNMDTQIQNWYSLVLQVWLVSGTGSLRYSPDVPSSEYGCSIEYEKRGTSPEPFQWCGWRKMFSLTQTMRMSCWIKFIDVVTDWA